MTEDPRENNDDERRASESHDAPSEVWTPVGPLATALGSKSSGSPRAGSPRPSLLDRARRISPPPSRSQSPPTAPPAKEWPPEKPLTKPPVVTSSDATRPSPASSLDSEPLKRRSPGSPQGWRRRRSQLHADARVKALEEEASATRRRHREDLQSIREARERAASDLKETKARLEAGRDRAKKAAARFTGAPARETKSTRGAFSRWRGRPAPSPGRAPRTGPRAGARPGLAGRPRGHGRGRLPNSKRPRLLLGGRARLQELPPARGQRFVQFVGGRRALAAVRGRGHGRGPAVGLLRGRCGRGARCMP